MRPHPPGDSEERPSHIDDGSDLCLRHLQQSLHLSGNYQSSQPTVHSTNSTTVLPLVHGLPTIIPPQLFPIA